MKYQYSEDKFNKTFSYKYADEVKRDGLSITHHANVCFRIFPFKATSKTKTKAITDLRDTIADFVKSSLDIKTDDVSFEDLMKQIIEVADVQDNDVETMRKIIKDSFFVDDHFVAKNIGLYAYQNDADHKVMADTSNFLVDIFELDQQVKNTIEQAMKNYSYNVLEQLVVECIGSQRTVVKNDHKKYFVMFTDAAKKFHKDFKFMLENDMTSPKEIADLFSVYYFYYISQTCIILNKFCDGKHDEAVPLYYALDWEKISKSRKCYSQGWKMLEDRISNIFSHSITLELLNQVVDQDDGSEHMFDYIELGKLVSEGTLNDDEVAHEITQIENKYTSCVGDYNKFDQIAYDQNASSKTERAIKHLYNCVYAQFINTKRQRAHGSYVESFNDFCKTRWLKNRKACGLVLNLKESDVIFLTKISIQNQEQIRLIDLFKNFEARGIYLDQNSKDLLQEFYTKLNLLEKKSDSGDAQYVKRIL